MKPSVFITRKLPDEIVAPLKEMFTVRMWDSEEVAVTKAVLREEIAQVDALWTMISDTIDRDMLEHAKNVKVVSRPTRGNSDSAGTPVRSTTCRSSSKRILSLATATSVPSCDTFFLAVFFFAALSATSVTRQRAPREGTSPSGCSNGMCRSAGAWLTTAANWAESTDTRFACRFRLACASRRGSSAKQAR